MYGEKKQFTALKCRYCLNEVGVFVDPEDIERHERGELVQRAFADRNGVPYLTAAERELFVSKMCGKCWNKYVVTADDSDDEIGNEGNGASNLRNLS